MKASCSCFSARSSSQPGMPALPWPIPRPHQVQSKQPCSGAAGAGGHQALCWDLLWCCAVCPRLGNSQEVLTWRCDFWGMVLHAVWHLSIYA